MIDRSSFFSAPKKQPASRANSLLWIFEPLERRPDYARRRMFGSDAAYLGELLCLVVSDRGDPWDGLLVCTSQDRHQALVDDMPSLRPHAVLGKWLYVPQDDESFEAVADEVVRLVLAGDSRIGVEPKPRARRRASSRA